MTMKRMLQMTMEILLKLYYCAVDNDKFNDIARTG